jgi:hypothetical protein
VGQRSPGIGGNRNVSLDAESAASSAGIADGVRADMVQEAERNDVALRLLGGVTVDVRAQGGLLPAFEREYADLDWITQKGKSSQVQRFFESLGYVPQTRSNVRRAEVVGLEDMLGDR